MKNYFVKKNNKERVQLLDEIRGFVVTLMILYHGFYFFGDFFGFGIFKDLYEFFTPAEPFFACVFIGICGFSCALSHSNIKRGLLILGFGLGITLVTGLIMPLLGFTDCEIWFGILHFLGLSLLIYGIFSKWIDKINPYLGIVISTLLYPFFYNISNGYLGYGDLFRINLPKSLCQSNWLVPLGIRPPTFASADYFPVFPFIFVFFTGLFIGKVIKQKGFKPYTFKSRLPFLAFLGRNAFLVYIIHVPVIVGIGYILEFLLRK